MKGAIVNSMKRQTCKISPIMSHSTQNKIQSHLLFSDLAALLIITVVVVAFSLCYGKVQVCSKGRWGRWQQLAWGMILLQLALIKQQQKLLLWGNTMSWEGKWLQQFMFWNATNSIMQTQWLAIWRHQTAEKRNPNHLQHLLKLKYRHAIFYRAFWCREHSEHCQCSGTNKFKISAT